MMKRRNTGSSSNNVQSLIQSTNKWTPCINIFGDLFISYPPWPVPSNILMPCNYFLCESVKDNVYKYSVMKFKFKKIIRQFPDKNFQI